MSLKNFLFLFLFLSPLAITIVESKPDSNFYIFLCFGQSNMQGQGQIEEQDKKCPERFQMMPAIDMKSQQRTKYNWYTATPPLCSGGGKISPADYFGRRMVEKLPSKIKIGVINVAVSGCKIELFDEQKKDAYISSIQEDWLINLISQYNNDPFKVLVDAAKEAQKSGVIRGILMHQGESNYCEEEWPKKVKKVYEDLLRELDLKAEKVPLLAGEVVTAQYKGSCSRHNEYVAKLPEVIPTCYVISAENLEDQGDRLHFSTAAYRLFGMRYADKMLSLIEEMDKTSTGVVVFIVILIIALLAVGGYFAYRKFFAGKGIKIGYSLFK